MSHLPLGIDDEAYDVYACQVLQQIHWMMEVG